MRKDLILVGDVHGQYRELIYRLTKRYKIENAEVLVLGDFGIGFHKPGFMEDEYNWSKEKLEESDININVLRGNHDDPAYFKEPKPLDFERLHFLEDHKVYNLAGRDVYVVGGANSVDIVYTDSLTGKEKRREEGVDWWKDEDIVRINKNNLPIKVDIIATHTAPLSFDPITERLDQTPVEQYEKILEERRYLDEVLKNVNTDYWYYGHFHKTFSGSYGKILYKCLTPLEFYTAPEHKESNPQGELNEGDETVL